MRAQLLVLPALVELPTNVRAAQAVAFSTLLPAPAPAQLASIGLDSMVNVSRMQSIRALQTIARSMILQQIPVPPINQTDRLVPPMEAPYALMDTAPTPATSSQIAQINILPVDRALRTLAKLSATTAAVVQLAGPISTAS